MISIARHFRGATTGAFLAVCFLFAAPTFASGSGPDSGDRAIPFQGHLELDGRPISAEGVELSFLLQGRDAGGDLVTDHEWTYGPVATDVFAGEFQARIGAGDTLPGWVFVDEVVTVAVIVGTGDDAVQLAGEQRIYPVPFSYWSAAGEDVDITGTLSVSGHLSAATMETASIEVTDIEAEGARVTINDDVTITGSLTLPAGTIAQVPDFSAATSGDGYLSFFGSGYVETLMTPVASSVCFINTVGFWNDSGSHHLCQIDKKGDNWVLRNFNIGWTGKANCVARCLVW